MKKILFITGTRADYGKMKPLIRSIEDHICFEAYIFVSGMHLIDKFGSTYIEILKDNYRNVYVDFSQTNRGIMSYDLGNVICDLTGYVNQIKPDMIVVHGDRVDALAGAIVGALNNIRVTHIEGGEVSGTIDESMRHAITKFAHLHMVCNEQAKRRLIQLGEKPEQIHIIGSPDIDIMLSDSLPTLEEVKERYDISFHSYAILMYHPVTTEFKGLRDRIRKVISALIASKRNYIVVYPNNDYGSEIILSEYERIANNPSFRCYPSLRFEYFLTLLKNAEFMIGNSSAGIRETGIYGVPSIDVGTRQENRYSTEGTNIQHVHEDQDEILEAIRNVGQYRKKVFAFGDGNSTAQFMRIIERAETWSFVMQKRFEDIYFDF